MNVIDTIIKDIRSEIAQGLLCPYCGQKSELIESASFYNNGQNYGYMYICRPCDATVGTHKGTTIALGRLANGTLRAYKKQAHLAFDIIWKHKISPAISKKIARSEAYKWLAKQMDIPVEECHIGMFNENQCIQVMQICSQYKFEEDEN